MHPWGWPTVPPDATCTVCGHPFVNNHTPMSEDGVCLFCRPSLTVTCARCGATCPGAFDGLKSCAGCRSEPLGAQQYADKQRALMEYLHGRGLIGAPLDVIMAEARERSAGALPTHHPPSVQDPPSTDRH